MNDAAVLGRLCDKSEHPLQSITTVKSNGEWKRTQNKKVGAVPRKRRNKGQTARRLSRFGQAIFQPYKSPNLLHGCTFVSLNLHTVVLWCVKN